MNYTIEKLTNLSVDEKLTDIKSMSKEEKISFLNLALTTDGIVNANIISNIIVLCTGLSDIDKDLSELPEFFFKDTMEYIDIKQDSTIKENIKNYCTRLCEYFLGVLEGLSVKLSDLRSHIPNLYYHSLFGIKMPNISKLLNKYLKYVDLTKIKPAENSMLIYSSLISEDSAASKILSSLIESIEIKEE
jgi:hypothetical protein